MKVYISADIEGVTGICNWNEADRKSGDYFAFAEQMQREVVSACNGANKAGAKEILIKDAHDSARNLSFEGMPTNVSLIRGFSGHPYSMMEGIDSSFDASIMIGYHSRGGSSANPLSHTMSTAYSYIKINGVYADEFLINAYISAYNKVPVVLVSGDKGLCDDVKGMFPSITTVESNTGIGSSVISRHPSVVEEEIALGVEKALKNIKDFSVIDLPKSFEVEICYKDHKSAFKASFYPEVELVNPNTIVFRCEDYFDVLRLLMFV